MAQLEWTLAARYLRLVKRRSLRIHVLTLVLALVAIGNQLAAMWMLKHHAGFLAASPLWRGYFQWGRPLSIVALVLVLVFVVLVRRLTIFTTISTFGLFLGTGALVVVLSVMSGFERDLKRKILGTNAHIVVTAPDRVFTDYREVAKRLVGTRDVIGWTPFLSSEVMISSQSNLSGVILKGIDPSTVSQVTDLQRNLEEGSLDHLTHPEKVEPPAPTWRKTPDGLVRDAAKPAGESSPDEAPGGPAEGELPSLVRRLDARRIPPTVIVGRELAKNLRLFLADDVNLVSPMGDIGPTGSMPKSRPFRVAGIFYSGMYEYDSKFVYLSLAAAQKFLGLEDEVTGFELKVRDPDETVAAVEDLKARLGSGFEVESWQDRNRNLFSALKVEKIAMFIVLCFVILVAGFSIIANGIMLVREKEKEIAILKSMGIRDRAVAVTFLSLGLFMGGIGTLTGIVAGIGACLGLRHFGIDLDTDVYYIDRLPVDLNAGEISTVLVAALLISLLAVLYPALIAARLRPVDGLRYEH